MHTVPDLTHFEYKAKNAIRAFWGNPDALRQSGMQTAGDPGAWRHFRQCKNLAGFEELMADIVRANGLEEADIYRKNGLLTLPGYFRPSKFWSLLIFFRGHLVALMEFKFQTAPSFGNNFNLRIEQAVGSAYDFWAAYRQGLFGTQQQPFVGWMILVEESPESDEPVGDKSPHFPVCDEFRNVSYLRRYDLFCKKLMKEQLYSAAAVVSSPREAMTSGEYSDVSVDTSLKSFVTRFAAHIAATAANMAASL